MKLETLTVITTLENLKIMDLQDKKWCVLIVFSRRCITN